MFLCSFWTFFFFKYFNKFPVIYKTKEQNISFEPTQLLKFKANKNQISFANKRFSSITYQDCHWFLRNFFQVF